MCLCFVFLGGNQDGKFSVGFRDGVVRTVVGLDRETQAAYTLVIEAIGVSWIHTFIIFSILIFTQSVFIFIIIGLVLFVIFKASPFSFCMTMMKKSDACTSAVISDYCSTAFVPVWKARTKTLRFSCFGNHWVRVAYLLRGPETREGRRGRDNVKLCHRTELHILS